MNFDAYLHLKDIALSNCEKCGRSYPDVKNINPIVLAYIGDVVFSSYVRLRLLPESGQVRILHDLSSKIVSAVCQAEAMRAIVKELTEEELGVYHRGRNAKSMVPKSATVQEYREATAFEALIGYLFLCEEKNSCEEIMEKAFLHIVQQLKK